MAKRKHNKSLAIREHYEQNPGDKPKAIVEALKAKGIEADAAYISMTLSKLRKAVGAAPAKAGRKGKKRRGRPAGSGKRAALAAVSQPVGGKFGFEELNLAKQLVGKMGGAAEAKQLIDVLG